MNKEINQKISQFLDNELHHTELNSFLLNIKQQPQLVKKMNRYQTISHLLSAEDVLMANTGFLDRVSQEIKQEPHHFLPKQNTKKRQLGFWSKASVALAASVAIVAVIVSQKIEVLDSQSSLMLAQKQTEETLQHKRFKAYLQAHSDDLYTHGSLGYQPLARVASFSQK